MVTIDISIHMQKRIQSRLEQEGSRDPFQAHYVLPIQVNNDTYRLSLLPHKPRKLTALQVVRVRGEELSLITDRTLMNALLTLWLSS